MLNKNHHKIVQKHNVKTAYKTWYTRKLAMTKSIKSNRQYLQQHWHLPTKLMKMPRDVHWPNTMNIKCKIQGTHPCHIE